MTYHKGKCSYRREDSAYRFNIGPMLVLNNPPAGR
jgi:hypothetical protein